MKNLLLTGLAVAALSMPVAAQQRMTLHEEFTGENCPPCASTNPAFWALLNGGTNPNKVIHISYMSPIPSSGWFYMQTQAMSDTRITYYTVPFAPYGRYDGAVPDPGCSGGSSAGHPGCFTQADIDAEYAVASPFNMTTVNSWNSTYDSVITTVTVTCVAPYTGSAVYLRAGLIQTVDFPTPPGSNGETHFENVVRAMYPNALGTAVPTTWTVGMTQTYTLIGALPSFVAKDAAPYMVTWIQNDGDKVVAQASRGIGLPPVPNDASISAIGTPTGLTCVANGPYTPAHTVTLKNSGSNNITSATIYYSVDGAATFLSTPWTGTLAPAATTVVTMPATALTVAGASSHSFYDSVANVNGGGDQNTGNNTKGQGYFLESTNGVALPYSTSFELVDMGKFYGTDVNNNGATWGTYTSSTVGHTGTYAKYFNCYAFPAGEKEVMTLPEIITASPSAIDFYAAYAQYDATTDDQLEVVYSTDCGTTWTSLWSKAGAALSTSAITTSQFIPTAAKYKLWSVSLNTVPANAMVGFRGTSDFGNIIWIDDVNMRSGAAVAVNEVTSASTISLFPNPATTEITMNFDLKQATSVSIDVYDAVGRVVYNIPAQQMNSGASKIKIPVSGFASGIYNLVMTTDGGKSTERFTVAK